MSNVDEFLNFRTETRKQIEIRELQWKVDEQGFSQKDMQLQEQIWELESLQRQNNRDKSAAEESKRLDIHNHNVGIKSRLDQFKRQITLSSLKHCNITEFEMEKNRYEKTEQKIEYLYQTPLASLIAIYEQQNPDGYSSRKVNKVDYYIGLFANKPYRTTIYKLLGERDDPSLNTEGGYYTAIEIYHNRFKTLEDAETFKERNKARLIKDYIPRIDRLNFEVQSAEDDFNAVFDFRLIEGPEFERGHSGDKKYTITKAERNYMELSWSKDAWAGDERIEFYGKISVKQDGFSFQIDGDLEDKSQIYRALANYFTLPHLESEIQRAYDAHRAQVSEEKRLKVLAMSDEELIKHYYIRSPEEAQAFKNKMNDGKHTINYYDWSVVVREVI